MVPPCPPGWSRQDPLFAEELDECNVPQVAVDASAWVLMLSAVFIVALNALQLRDLAAAAEFDHPLFTFYHTMSAGVLMISLSLGLAPIAYRGKAVQQVGWAFILLALGLLALLRAAALFVGSVLLRSGIDQLLVLQPQRAHVWAAFVAIMSELVAWLHAMPVFAALLHTMYGDSDSRAIGYGFGDADGTYGYDDAIYTIAGAMGSFCCICAAASGAGAVASLYALRDLKLASGNAEHHADAYLHEIITAFSTRAAQLAILFLAVFMGVCLPMLVSNRIRGFGGVWICCSVAGLCLLRVAWELLPGALRIVMHWHNMRRTKAQQAARAKRIHKRRRSSDMRKIHAVTAGELEPDQFTARQTSCAGDPTSSHNKPGAGGTLHGMREASVDTGTSFNFTQSDRSITGFTPDVPTGTGTTDCSPRQHQSEITSHCHPAQKTSPEILTSAADQESAGRGVTAEEEIARFVHEEMDVVQSRASAMVQLQSQRRPNGQDDTRMRSSGRKSGRMSGRMASLRSSAAIRITRAEGMRKRSNSGLARLGTAGALHTMALAGRRPSGQTLPMARRGVSLEFLRQWSEHKGLRASTKTTAEVCNTVIKPATLAHDISYFELLVRSEPIQEASTDWWGTATHFLSHSWSYRFVDLLDVLEQHEEQLSSSGVGRVYYWFDIFVMNQHSRLELGAQLTNNLQLAVGGAGKLIMALDTWSSPAPLNRVWCLLEIFTALHSDADVTMVMSASQVDSFKHNLEHNRDALEEVIDNIDAQNANATEETDKEAIFKVIREGVGFDRFNSEIQSALRASLRRIVLRIMLLRQAPTNRRASARRNAQRRPSHSLPRPANRQPRNRNGSADCILQSQCLQRPSLANSAPTASRSLGFDAPSSTSNESDDKTADEILQIELAKRDVMMTTTSVRCMLAADALRENERET